jgi:hypothetical protein
MKVVVMAAVVTGIHGGGEVESKTIIKTEP